MPICYMLIGLPASGKTYYRKGLRGMVLSTDDYIHEYAKAEGKTYDEVFQEAIKAADVKLKDDLLYAIEKKLDIVWDQTNLTPKSRAKKLEKLPEEYQKVAIYFISPSEEVWRARLAKRTDQKIPEKILRSMQKQIEFPSTSEGFHEIKVVDSSKEVGWN